ncbi:MAG: hypothetical protein KF744_02655 [Taibaiella sp.]|nr:hypothetical protein [Taibaiella sp.]
MRKVLLSAIFIFTCIGSFAQEDSREPANYDGAQRTNKQAERGCSKLYLDLGTGINANTSLLGGGVDYHITSDISLNAGIGLASSWGTKFYFGGKGYLKPCHKGWAFGAGATYSSGISNFATKLETIQGQELVELELLPQANIFASAYKYWGLGKGRKSRFFLQLGISKSVTQKKFNQLSGSPVTSNSASVVKILSPGGLIVGLGFCFGT